MEWLGRKHPGCSKHPGCRRDGSRASVPISVLVIITWLLVPTGCRREGSEESQPKAGPVPESTPENAAPTPVTSLLFDDVAKDVGLDFVHFNGMSGELYFVEIAGGGVALLDYDCDGDLDVFLTQGHMLGDKPIDVAVFPPRGPMPLSDRLYRNDLRVAPDGSRTLRFVDVTEDVFPELQHTTLSRGRGERHSYYTSGIPRAGSAHTISKHAPVDGDRVSAGIERNEFRSTTGTGYGMGVAVGDINRDGRPDLYVTNFGSNQLWLNTANGHFRDITAAAGVDDQRWSSSACFIDYDRDGWPDLFLCNYVDFRIDNHRTCRHRIVVPDYCGPNSWLPERDRLFHNNRDGTFTDVTVESGIDQAFGAGLGVVTADFNGDGWPDLYVANDAMANQLWINEPDSATVESNMAVSWISPGETPQPRRFRDRALLAGCALNGDGDTEAGMGVDAADFDDDGDVDLFLAHLINQSNTLYRNDGTGLFSDATRLFALDQPSRGFTGFGTVWLDFDLDGRLDVFVANGEVRQIPELVQADDPYPLDQPNLLFRRASASFDDGPFQDVSDRAGPAFAEANVSRGAAVGDLDNDGDPDIVVANNAGPVRLLLNRTIDSRSDRGMNSVRADAQDGPPHWLGLRLIDPNTGGDVPGTRVQLRRPDNRVLWRRSRVTGSYLSASDPRILFGLGDEAEVGELEVHWPDGLVERWMTLTSNTWHELMRGTGD